MSQENVEVVQRFFASWGKGDLHAALECVHTEVEFDWSGSLSPYRDVYRGHTGIEQAWAETTDAWEQFIPEIEGVIDCGPGRLITPTLVRGKGKGSGVQTEAHGAVLWMLRDKRIILAKLFQNKKEALEAVGLSEQDAQADSS